MKKTNRALVMAGVFAAMLLSALDQTIVATAMPRIVAEFNSLSHLSWVFTAYMLASTVTVPIYGKLSDIFGRKFFFISGIIIFLIGSALSGVAQSMTQLIIFRAFQGIGAGAMMVNSLAVVGDLYSPQERGKFQGIIGASFALATIVGPLLGGWLTDNFSWRWVFYVNLPVGAITIAILYAAMPRIAHEAKDRSIDFAGAAIICGSLVALLLAFVWAGSEYAWLSWQIVSLLGTALVGLTAFVFVEKRAHDPILSPSLFKSKVFAISAIVTFLVAFGMFGAIMYITLFAQGVIGVSATNSGLILMPMMLGVVFSSVVSGQLVSRTGKYKILTVVGISIATFALFFFSRIGISTTEAALMVRMVLLGLGLGVTMPVFTIIVQSAFSQERLGEVTAGVTLFRSVGGTVGTAILGGVLNAKLVSNLADIQSYPAFTAVKQMFLQNGGGSLDGSTIQGLLSPQVQTQVQTELAKLPADIQGQAASAFAQFLELVKAAFSNSLDFVFIIATSVMAIALVTVLFLPEIPIRKSHRGTLMEAGMELEAEFAQPRAKDEPEL